MQCSFSMGYITSAIYINPQTNLILTSTTKNEGIHSVIFEPQPKIQLTQSSYKGTSFLYFQPFHRGFQSVNEYLKDLTRDINNPNYFQRIVSSFSNFKIPLLSNETVSRVNPYGCKSKMKLEQYQLEIQYIIKVFHAIYKKYLTAIDHIDYHPSQIQNTT